MNVTPVRAVTDPFGSGSASKRFGANSVPAREFTDSPYRVSPCRVTDDPLPEPELLPVQVQEVVVATAILKCLLQAPAGHALIELGGAQIESDPAILQSRCDIPTSRR